MPAPIHALLTGRADELAGMLDQMFEAGAAAVGALLRGAVRCRTPVVAIVSGGNVDADKLRLWL